MLNIIIPFLKSFMFMQIVQSSQSHSQSIFIWFIHSLSF